MVAPMATEREHHEYQELLGAYALDALPDDERAELEAHLATCDECVVELADLRLAVYALPLSVEERSASPSLRDRIRAAAEAESSLPDRDEPSEGTAFASNVVPIAPVDREPLTARPVWRTLLPWATAAVFLLFALAMLGWNLTLRQPGNEQVIALQPASGVTGAGGQLIYLRDRQVMIVKPQGLPALAPGKVYEVWLIQGNTPVAAGVLNGASDQLAVAADLSQYQALAITVESGPLGSPAPTGDKVIVTPL